MRVNANRTRKSVSRRGPRVEASGSRACEQLLQLAAAMQLHRVVVAPEESVSHQDHRNRAPVILPAKLGPPQDRASRLTSSNGTCSD